MADSAIGELGTAAPRPTPVKDCPLPRVTVLLLARSRVPAATDISHGVLCATVDAPGPSLPAEVDTNTPAWAAPKNAASTASTELVRLPEIEKLITSAPSVVASSMACTLSEV